MRGDGKAHAHAPGRLRRRPESLGAERALSKSDEGAADPSCHRMRLFQTERVYIRPLRDMAQQAKGPWSQNAQRIPQFRQFVFELAQTSEADSLQSACGRNQG